MSKLRSYLVLILLVVGSVSLATVLQPRTAEWNRRAQGGGVLKVLLGDGRRLFANQFFTEADIYFHSGYYPSVFDYKAAPKDSKHMTEEGDHHDEQEELKLDFFGPPRDWVEAFGRRFTISKHTHLGNGKEREMLPWLRLSADLDPQRIDTYTVAAYWLQNMGRVKEAEQFLREGLSNNPQSYEILYELASLYETKRNDPVRAQNLYALALKRWQEREAGKAEPDRVTYEKITFRLGLAEERTGLLERAIEHLQMAQKVSPNAPAIEARIERLKGELARSRNSKP